MKNKDKKGSITEELEILKQRREERKTKNQEDKKGDKKNDNNGKACDAHYENLMKKKKIAFNVQPDQVKKLLNLFIKI
jgi:hypothetical protein